MGPANTPLRLGRAQGWGYMCSVADKPRSGTCHGAPSILPSAASVCLSPSLACVLQVVRGFVLSTLNAHPGTAFGAD